MLTLFRCSARFLLTALALTASGLLTAHPPGYAPPPPPPTNDDCANAAAIVIPGSGFDYGTFTSAVSDLTMATGQTGEHFEFAGHTKSVWYEVSLPTHRNFKVRLVAASGSIVSGVSLTLYRPVGCLPAKSSLISAQSGDEGGLVENNSCDFGYGTYKVQITTTASGTANIFVEITLACPTGTASKYDCPANAYLFNGGNPLPQNASFSDAHTIGCQSLDAANEGSCLPLPNPADYLQSTWYVFKTGSRVDLLSVQFNVSPSSEKVGYRIFEGDARLNGPATLAQIGCGLAREDGGQRFIEFPCLLQPNTTYSIALFFHKNFTNNGNTLTVTLRQRGTGPTGWPKPVLPPVRATNQLGTLPGGGANGTQTTWRDSFNCSAFISKNPCPPANPASGTVAVGTKTYDLATWATFTLANDANVDFQFFDLNYSNALHTRIFKKTLTGNCPSPDPASTDLYYEFPGTSGYSGCMPAGDYSVQVLSSSVYPLPTTFGYWNAWNYANLGTDFRLRFTVMSLTDPGLFRLDATGNFNAVNNLNALQNNVLYPSTPAVFVCANTVLPDGSKCAGMTKAMYREVRIGDADGNATPDSGLLCMSGLRTDFWADPPHVYYFGQGDANQLATAAGTHTFGQKIPGLTDWAGFCIDDDDYTAAPGVDNFCACVTPGIYTLGSLGDADNVGRGDAPGFRFDIQKTVHDSRANAEVIAIGAMPGTYTSSADVFSCKDNLGSMPPCGNRKKLIFREFFLSADEVVSITETGTSNAPFSLFRGRASDPAAMLTPLAGCANNILLTSVVNECAPLPAGWYTLVSYGEGPNYTDKHVWNDIGDPRDVGKTTRISISVKKPDVPNFNRPQKAHLAGITDWAAVPPANPNATTSRLYTFPTDTFCAPDTPFISNNIAACAAGSNRVSFYVFEITKRSFVQIRNVDETFYTEVFPFDVKAQPGSLLTVPPVYPCLSKAKDYRQLCDLPPGKYTIAIFANDTHEGRSVSPLLYVEAIGYSRFDHARNAYDYGHIPKTNAFVNGKTGDTHPIPGQHPSRDVFYCTTGATATDPDDTRCNTQLNPLIYAQPDGVPKPLFLQNNPPAPLAQPWRNLWYTFVLSGSGECTLQPNVLGGSNGRPIISVYESDVNGNIPWATLQNTLGGVDSTLASGLKFVATNRTFGCDGYFDLDFTKNGCLRDSVRYYVIVSFDADYYPNLPNQAVSLSIKYESQPTFPALYDERATANVVNGLGQIAPPYTAAPLVSGSNFVGPDFSLLCYTRNATDPGGCTSEPGESAWFKFTVSGFGQLQATLKIPGALPGDWFANPNDMEVFQETTPGGPLTKLPMKLVSESFSDPNDFDRIQSCIGPGTYYLLVRNCWLIDPIQAYAIVLQMADSPGDYCTNAVPLNVPNFSPATAAAVPDCHTIGTDFGETAALGMGCLAGPGGKKTSWFRVTVTAGLKMNVRFQLAENLTGATLSDLPYRVFFGSCGALTPIVCSAVGSNIITQNCLPPGDYYVQVAMPEKVGSTAVEGTFTLTVTATPSTDPACSPTDLTTPKADFTSTATCTAVTLVNLSTAGTDIAYQWQFPGGSPITSPEASPTWVPPGSGTYSVTLTVTNTALNKSSTSTQSVSVTNPFAAYQPMPDGEICNGLGSVTLDATLPGAAYTWNTGDTTATRSITTAGTFWVKISKDGCEKRDTATVTAVAAKREITAKLCPDGSITVGGEVFDKNKPSGTVTIPMPSCDSLLTVSLSFYPPPPVGKFDTTLCETRSFIFAGKIFDKTQPSGTVLLPSFRGCDSTVQVTGYFQPLPPDVAVNAARCASGTFTFGGKIFDESNPSGTVVKPAKASGGCDTTFHVSLKIYRPDTALVTAQRCENQVFTYGGATFTPQNPSGLVVLQGKAWLGCDSTVRVQVTFAPTVLASAQPVICPGGSVTVRGVVFSETHLADTLLLPGTGSACDTMLHVAASVLPKIQASLVRPICPGETVLVGTEKFDENRLTGTVVLKAHNDCDSTVLVSLTALPPALGTLTGTYCHRDTVLIFGKKYTAANPSDTVVRTGLAPNGCDSIWAIALTFKDLKTSASARAGCTGTSLSLAPTTPGAVYTWNTAAATDTLSVTAPGTYTVSVSDAAGCVIGEETFTVTFGALAPPTATASTPCSGGTATLTASGSSGEYQWFDVPTGGTALDTSTTFITGPLNVGATYYAEAFQAAVPGCQSQRTAVQVQVHPTYDLSIRDTICNGDTLRFGSQMLTQSGIYVEVFQTQHGCDSTVHLDLTVPQAVALSAVTTAPTCFNSVNGSITVSANGGTGDFDFSLGNGPFQPNPTFWSLAANTYTLTVRDANGCTTSASATLAAPPALVFSVKKADPNCPGSADGSIEAQASGGTGPLEYGLNGGVFQPNPAFGNLAAGNYALTVRDSNGCKASASAVLTDPLPIGLTAVTSGPTCFGFADGSITAKTLGGTLPLTFGLHAGLPQPSPVFENLSAGVFQLVAVDGRGCRDSVQTTLSEPPQILLALDAVSPLCPLEKPLGSVSAAASGGQPPLLYALGSGVFSGVSEFENLPPALYTVTVQDAAGCEASAGIEVEAPLALPLTLPSVLTLHWGDSVLLLPQIGFVTDSLAWSPSEGLSCTICPRPWARPSKTTNYELVVWSAQGCSVTARVRVEVKREVRIYVPNVFRPDGSGLNDELLVFGGPELRSVRSLSVYDRWGNALWQATDFPPNSLVGWDGRARGKQVNPGVYVWVCEIELNDGTRELLAGDVTVVR